ncbi:MAG TPA: hypothetical protein VIV57_25700 [Anaeromyxobacter sp.]
MGKKQLPDLPDTGRRYLDHTVRARLHSPGITRYPPRQGPGGRIAFAVIVAVAVIVAMLWLR